MPRGLALNGKKWLYRTTDWAWKGFNGIKNTMRNTPLTPQPNPQPNPQTTPPINETPPNNPPKPFGSGLQLTKGSCNDKKSLFPIIMIQKTSETKVFGNSAASTYWKRSFCNERETPLPNMMSQPTKKPLKPVCLAIAWLRPNESTAIAMKESHLFPTWWANPQKTSETSVFGNSAASILKAQLLQWQRATSSQHDEPTHKKLLKPVCLAIVRFRPTESTALALIEGAFYQITSSL